jgi:methyl-accepting chemotaxis protein
VKIGTKLFSVFVLMEFLVISVACMELYIAKISNDGLDTVYKDRVVPLEELKAVSDMYAVDIVDTSHKALVGAIDLKEARKHIADAQSRIFNKWKAYLATYLVPEEKSQVAKIEPLMKKADAAVDKLNVILLKQDRAELAQFTATELYPAIDPLTKKLSELVTVQLVVAKQEYQKSHNSYQKGLLLSIILVVVGSILSGVLTIQVIRHLLRDLGGEPAYIREIARTVADGDLSLAVMVDADNKGSVLWGMKIMVENLRALVSEKLKNEQLEVMQKELDKHVAELEATLARVRQLEGILPICVYCKNIRDNKGNWQMLEQYISEHSEAMFSHGICPNCAKEAYEKMKNGD